MSTRAVLAAWAVLSALTALGGGRHGRRGVLRGTAAAGLSAAALGAVLAPLARRLGEYVTGRRRTGRRGTGPPITHIGILGRLRSRRMPPPAVASPVIAAGVAFAVGVGLELPLAAVPAGVAATALAVSRVAAGIDHPLALTSSSALGVMVAAASRRIWPVAPRHGADLKPVRPISHRQPSRTGEGLTVVVNPGAGPALGRNPARELKSSLPDARVIELAEGDDVVQALEEACEGARALGIVGGDGSVNAAAGVAHAHEVPLFVVPGGTLNHFARDLGVHSAVDAVEAVRDGSLIAVDLASIDGRPFLNTASFGGYAELVDAREKLEDRIGKWPALMIALVRVLRRSEPVDVELDGRPTRLWMIFIGNCVYHPHGFAPSWRRRLDDGQLDIRLVEAGGPRSRARLVLAVLTGNLGRCQIYEERLVRSLHVRSPSGGMRLARDGETFDGSSELTVCKHDKPLLVFAPHTE